MITPQLLLQVVVMVLGFMVVGTLGAWVYNRVVGEAKLPEVQTGAITAQSLALDATRREADAYRDELALVRERTNRIHDELDAALEHNRLLTDKLAEAEVRRDLTPLLELQNEMLREMRSERNELVEALNRQSAETADRHQQFATDTQAIGKMVIEILKHSQETTAALQEATSTLKKQGRVLNRLAIRLGETMDENDAA